MGPMVVMLPCIGRRRAVACVAEEEYVVEWEWDASQWVMKGRSRERENVCLKVGVGVGGVSWLGR